MSRELLESVPNQYLKEYLKQVVFQLTVLTLYTVQYR